jgi:hypothetical protein
VEGVACELRFYYIFKVGLGLSNSQIIIYYCHKRAADVLVPK